MRIRWVRCRAVAVTEGTWVEVEASSGGGLISKAMGKADRGPTSRALQVIRLLTAGAGDAANGLPRPPHPAGPGHAGRVVGGHALPALHRAAP